MILVIHLLLLLLLQLARVLLFHCRPRSQHHWQLAAAHSFPFLTLLQLSDRRTARVSSWLAMCPCRRCRPRRRCRSSGRRKHIFPCVSCFSIAASADTADASAAAGSTPLLPPAPLPPYPVPHHQQLVTLRRPHLAAAKSVAEGWHPLPCACLGCAAPAQAPSSVRCPRAGMHSPAPFLRLQPLCPCACI